VTVTLLVSVSVQVVGGGSVVGRGAAQPVRTGERRREQSRCAESNAPRPETIHHHKDRL